MGTNHPIDISPSLSLNNSHVSLARGNAHKGLPKSPVPDTESYPSPRREKGNRDIGLSIKKLFDFTDH
jgi:hypothetical protein